MINEIRKSNDEESNLPEILQRSPEGIQIPPGAGKPDGERGQVESR